MPNIGRALQIKGDEKMKIKRNVEVFSAGCPVCNDAVDLV